MSWLHANGDRGTYPATFYADRADLLPPFPPLHGETRADLCVIGGGLTGLSAAFHGAKSGLSVLLLEAQRVGWGASGRNGGQVGSGFNWSQRRLEDRLGRAEAHALWALAEEAKAVVLGHGTGRTPPVHPRYGILSAALTEREASAAREEAAWMATHYGTRTETLTRADVAARIGTQAYAGGTLDPTAAFCDPLALTLGMARDALAAGATIHEGAEVHAIAPGPGGITVRTAQGYVTATHVVQATNGYAPWLTGPTAARVLPINNYIAVTEPLAQPPMREPLAVADSRFVVNYFWQTDDGRLVYGGGESYGKRFPGDIATRVRRNIARVYPDLSDVGLTHAWGGTLAVTATRLPYLAEVAPDVFSAGGYSGHGLALSALFGKLCVEAALGERTRFDLVGRLPVPALPGGRLLGGVMAQAGMVFGALKDRLP